MKSGAAAIHQFHYSACESDAITNQMLFIRRTLRGAGIDSEIAVGLNKTPRSLGIRDFDPNLLSGGDVVLIHHSHGNPLLSQLLAIKVPKAVIYHNITPSHFFVHDPHLAWLSELGRAQLPLLAEHSVACFGDSKFNCAELEWVGFRNPRPFPLLDLAVPATARLSTASDQKRRLLLFVGKLTPHKNQALLLQALFYLERGFPGKYALCLVGRRDPLYGEYLQLLAKSLGVGGITEFTGSISQSELESLYQRASAFVCLSLHEGFCVPLVEAMKYDVPVLALAVPGVTETLGNAGVQLDTYSPVQIAEAVDCFLDNEEMVSAVLGSQDQRLEELRQLHNAERVKSAVFSLIETLQRTGFSSTLPEVYL